MMMMMMMMVVVVVVVDRLVEMRVSVEDYSTFLSELSMFRIYLHATVDETDQLTATFVDFRLILPQLDIVVSLLTYLLNYHHHHSSSS